MIQTNKRLPKILLGLGFILLILNSTFGNALFKLGLDLIYPDNIYDISLFHLGISNIERFLNNFTGIIVSIWFIVNSKELENKYFWIISGYLFGTVALILYLVFKIIQSIESNNNHQESIKKILIFLVCIIPIRPLYTLIIERYLQNFYGLEKSGFLIKYDIYLDSFQIAIMILFNIWLGIKIFSYIKRFGKKPIIWSISTMFLGIIPLILFNLTEMLKLKNK